MRPVLRSRGAAVPAGRPVAARVCPRPTGRDAGLAYARYAAAALCLVLAAGAWLRASTLYPALLGGWSFRDAVHAHSHLALFGWTTPALFAWLAQAAPRDAPPAGDLHAHLVGALSAAAFAGFLAAGYTPATIALSAAHVVLWLWFAAAAWPRLAHAAPPTRRAGRAALALLAASGAGAMLPGFVRARGVESAWAGEMAVQAFLTPFTAGWLVLGAMGAAYAHLPRGRLAPWALGMTALGALPSAPLHVVAAPPVEWLPAVGRVGTLLVGAGTLAFACDLLRRSGVPLLRVAGAAALLKGAAEVAAGLGWGLALATRHPVVVAYLHLVLLGVVTPVLLATALGVERAPRRAGLFAAGTAVMLAAVAAPALPPVLRRAVALGLSPRGLLAAAFAGGVLAAAAGVAMAAPTLVRGRGAGPEPR